MKEIIIELDELRYINLCNAIIEYQGIVNEYIWKEEDEDYKLVLKNQFNLLTDIYCDIFNAYNK